MCLSLPDVSRPLDKDEELVAEFTLLEKHLALANLDLCRDGGDPCKFGLRASLEQRHTRDQAHLLVATDDHRWKCKTVSVGPGGPGEIRSATEFEVTPGP